MTMSVNTVYSSAFASSSASSGNEETNAHKTGKSTLLPFNQQSNLISRKLSRCVASSSSFGLCALSKIQSSFSNADDDINNYNRGSGFSSLLYSVEANECKSYSVTIRCNFHHHAVPLWALEKLKCFSFRIRPYTFANSPERRSEPQLNIKQKYYFSHSLIYPATSRRRGKRGAPPWCL